MLTENCATKVAFLGMAKRVGHSQRAQTCTFTNCVFEGLIQGHTLATLAIAGAGDSLYKLIMTVLERKRLCSWLTWLAGFSEDQRAKPQLPLALYRPFEFSLRSPSPQKNGSGVFVLARTSLVRLQTNL